VNKEELIPGTRWVVSRVMNLATRLFPAASPEISEIPDGAFISARLVRDFGALVEAKH
jgi:hypothetical protein